MMYINLETIMKDVLIVFGILLVVLIVISTLGGSIRYTESFENSADKDKLKGQKDPKKEPYEDSEPKKEEDKKETVEGFDGGAYAGIP